MRPLVGLNSKPPLPQAGLMYDMISEAGLAGSLVATFDPADPDTSASYNTTWIDNDFGNQVAFGATGFGTDKPTFNGVSGDYDDTTYFTFDGSDDFFGGLASGAWADNLHKANAEFSYITAVYLGSGSSGGRGFFTTLNNAVSGGPGLGFGTNSSLNPNFLVRGSSGFTSFSASVLTIPEDEWVLVGTLYKEGVANGTTYFCLSSSGLQTEAETASFANSASAAQAELGFGTKQQTVFGDVFHSDDRMAVHAFWNTALSETQMRAVANRVRLRYPTIAAWPAS